MPNLFGGRGGISAPTAARLNIQQRKFEDAKRAYMTCLQVGGVPIRGFQQGMECFKEVWNDHAPGGGICQALVNYWLVDHARGHSLWSRLYDDQGKFIKHSIIEIAKQHKAFGLPDASRPNIDTKVLQKERTTWWLKQNGLLRRRDIATNGELLSSGAARHSRDTKMLRGQRMGIVIATQGMANATNGTYRMISFTKDIGPGHVAAAWVERDVAFFDPNAGEYWFDTREKFITWMGLYVNGNTYHDYFDGVSIRDFAPAAYKGAGGLPRPT